MIGDFGVLPTGLAVKRIDDVITQMGTGLKADLGAAFDLLPQTPEGQLVNRLAEQVADLWEMGEQVYNSLYPDTANGVGLDNARALTNNFRIPETASVANGVIVTGTPGVVIPDTFQLSVVGSPDSVFQAVEASVIGIGGTVAISMVCTQAGPIQAAIGTLTQIVTPVVGVASATNPLGAELGTFAETDAEFRVRSGQQLNRVGTGTFDGIMLAVQKVANVSKVYMFINDQNVTDENGLAAHSVLLVVVGGVDADIRNAIFAAKGAGIETNGTVSGNVVDSQGVGHTIKFSRLSYVDFFTDVTIVPNSDPAVGPVFPGNGLEMVREELIAYGAVTYRAGQTVVTTALFTPINTVPGVLGATILIGLVYPPVSAANLDIELDALARIVTGNLTVHT